ncbi:hypothetical protein GCM10020229_14870 [Kitasatospora albolonga]
MAAATLVVLYASSERSLPVFLAGFTTLFVLAGLGNGSTYKMIPVRSSRPRRRTGSPELGATAEQAAAWSARGCPARPSG